MEEDVTVQHHEALIKQSSCRPQRVETICFRKAGIVYVPNSAAATGAHAVGLAPHHDCDVVDAGPLQGSDLPLQQGDAARFDEALGLVAGGAVQARPFPGREDDAPHDGYVASSQMRAV